MRLKLESKGNKLTRAFFLPFSAISYKLGRNKLFRQSKYVGETDERKSTIAKSI